MKEFSKEDLLNLEQLCRIKCTQEEEEKLLKNLKSIFEYMKQIDEVTLDGVLGKHNLLESTSNRMYEDQVEETIEREELLQNAPSQVGGMVRIPPVIEY
ncbi:MAG: Glutamyl-tRNA(Gln) amidotransferase subunit C, chloroplastic/mitochondrial [Chlamydiia bacterium]|nr:Glutamyl-tRNA(Gln) amidotransferase subunit C, chloroplastic/mitochondrial [Chlamydiia bacterium]